jgi:PAS domain S-box-containing protein
MPDMPSRGAFWCAEARPRVGMHHCLRPCEHRRRGDVSQEGGMQNAEHSLAQLIDVERLQRTCESLSAATGVTLAVLDPDGTILVSSGWQAICTQFHRIDEVTAAGCLESDTRITERVRAGTGAPKHIAYRCANGLWDVAFPLIVNDHHVATVFTGQFCYDDDEIDVEAFRRQARERGFDEAAYMDALADVPVLTHEKVEQTISFLADLVGTLSESGLHALRERESRAELQRSQEVLRAVLDTIPARVFWKDTDLRYLGANAPFARDAGYEHPEDLVAKDDFAMAWRDQAELYRDDDRSVIAGASKPNIEEPQTAADGEERTLLTSKVPLKDAAGEVIGVLGTYLDVTDRKLAEQASRESRELLQEVVEHDPSAIAVFDTGLRYVYVSQRFVDDYRLTDPDVIGKSHYDVFPEIPESVREVHRRVLEGEVERADEDPFPRRDGSVDWVRWECRPWYHGDGSVGGMVLYSQLINEQREAADALRRSREQYATFINATDDVAFLKDDQLRYIMINTAGEEFFGRPQEQVCRHTDADLLPAKTAAELRASDQKALETGGMVVSNEHVGERIYETRKFPVELGDGHTGVGGYVRDVTEQRRADAEIRRLATDLERRVEQRTSQLEATNRELESFAYSISHDLRSPLRALNGFSEILLQDYNDVLDAKGRGYLRRIKNAANHMAGLMDGLLQLSRLNRKELVLEEVDLSSVAREVLDELRAEEPERVVDAMVESGLIVEADPKLMRVALANLIGNAWKFTSRHETARIEIGAATLPGAGNDGAFFVKDNGAGFDQRYARNLFGAFQRLHTPEQFEGNGIGLATVKRIVHRHGGTVWAEGAVEQGATFWFTLAPGDKAETQSPSGPASSP